MNKPNMKNIKISRILSGMITEKHQREFGVYAARLHPVFSSSRRANLT